MSDYLRIMKNHANNLRQASSPVSTRSLVSQVLLGLDKEYNPMVAMIQGRSGITWPEMQVELLVFEKRLELQTNLKSSLSSSLSNSLSLGQGASINMVNNKDVGNQRHQNNNNRQNGFGRGNQRGGGGKGRGRARGYGSFNNKPTCQVCGKIGHTTLMCY